MFWKGCALHRPRPLHAQPSLTCNGHHATALGFEFIVFTFLSQFIYLSEKDAIKIQSNQKLRELNTYTMLVLMLIQIYCSMIPLMMVNLGCCLDCICKQLKPKPLGPPVRGFLDSLKQEDPLPIWSTRSGVGPRTGTWKKEAFPFQCLHSCSQASSSIL